MSFIVTARKWRPLQFKDVVGQQHITLTLQNSINSSRVHHAYLFSGPRGVGKTTTARILARMINCSDPIDSEPCNACESCTSILEAKSMDVIEIDGASNNSVDDIRKLRENAKYPPSTGNKKMYIIDEVHMLSTAAFNALLKILEEPPPHLMFVFATTEQHKVPATILSRCQRHEFRRIESAEIIGQLKEIANKDGISMDNDSLVTIANKADGSMRDAQSIFDQVVAFAGTDIKYSQMIEALNLVDAALFFNISESGKAGNIDSMFQISKEILTKGYDLQDVFGGLLEHYRNLLTVNVIGNTELIKESESNLAKYKTHATDFTKPELLRVLNILSNAEQAIRFASQPKIKFELTLVQIASLDSITEISELINLVKNENSATRPAAKQSSNIARESVTSYEIKKPAPKPAQFQANNITDSETEKPVTNSKPTDPESGWKDFLAEYSAKEGLALLKSLQVIFSDSEVIVYTEAEFTYNNLQNKKALIMDRMEEFFGRKIRFKVVLDADKQQELSNNSPNKFNKESETFTSQTITEEEKAQLHPTDRIIIEKFGAKRLKR